MTYVCSHCGGTFESTWTEKEARKEAESLWGKAVEKPEETRLVCGGCFRKYYDPRTAVPDAKA